MKAAAAAREKWNRRYAESVFSPFPDTPSPWLVENRELVRAARGGEPRALDVACGDGRNSRYLAELGFVVEAIDVSDVAISALVKAAAGETGLAIQARVVDLETQALPHGPYDVILDVNYLQRDLFASLAASLRPGGVLVFETFLEAHVDELGNSLDERFLLAPNELLRAFPQLIVRHYREGVVERSGRLRALAGLAAERPAVRRP